MIINSLQAWVIHKYWSGDTSFRVVFFTKELGLIHCFYKGGRTPKKQALLQAFTPLWLALDVRKESYFVRQLELSGHPLQLSGQSLFAGLYVNELVHYTLQPHDAHEGLHAAYLTAIESLSKIVDRMQLEVTLRRFERELLSACGYHMSLRYEANSLTPIVSHKFYHFIPGEGLVCATEGMSGKHILALADDALDNIAILKDAKRIMRLAIDHVLEGKTIKTRALFSK